MPGHGKSVKKKVSFAYLAQGYYVPLITRYYMPLVMQCSRC